jgi:hypothetical protein
VTLVDQDRSPRPAPTVEVVTLVVPEAVIEVDAVALIPAVIEIALSQPKR